MIVNPNKEEQKLFDVLDEWIIPGAHEGDKPSIDPSAPEEIKELFEKWLKMI